MLTSKWKAMKQLLTFIFIIISIVSFGQNIKVDSISHSSDSLASKDTLSDWEYEIVKKVYWSEIKPRGWVTDFEKLFTEEEIKQLDSAIVNFEKATSIEIAVVTIDTNYIPANYFDDFALYLAQNWKVGKKDKDNGILIAISKVHRRIRICNGYGIEKILTDEETKTIIDKSFTPYFKEGKYFEGTTNGINALITHLWKPGQNRDTTSSRDTVVYKSTLVPLKAPNVKAKKVPVKKDPLDCYITISTEGIKIKFSNKTLKDITVSALDTFIRENKIAEVSPKVHIVATKETSAEKIKDVVDALRRNNVNKFRLEIK